MEKYYNYYEEMKNKCNIGDLNSLTLSYRIDSFVRVCNLDLREGQCEELLSCTGMPYINKKLDNNNLKYSINFSRCYDDNGKKFVINGQYNSLYLFFANYYDKDQNKNIINNLPFKIFLGKDFDNYQYLMNIETIRHSKIRFDITKMKENEESSDKLTFYARINHFDIILKIVKEFINNPFIVFDSYNEVMNTKKVFYRNKELDIVNCEDKTIESNKKYTKR